MLDRRKQKVLLQIARKRLQFNGPLFSSRTRMRNFLPLKTTLAPFTHNLHIHTQMLKSYSPFHCLDRFKESFQVPGPV
jgi:hypothetical protein